MAGGARLGNGPAFLVLVHLWTCALSKPSFISLSHVSFDPRVRTDSQVNVVRPSAPPVAYDDDSFKWEAGRGVNDLGTPAYVGQDITVYFSEGTARFDASSGNSKAKMIAKTGTCDDSATAAGGTQPVDHPSRCVCVCVTQRCPECDASSQVTVLRPTHRADPSLPVSLSPLL